MQPERSSQPNKKSNHPDRQSADQGGKAHVELRFLTCGSVDDGKSTLIGRLLYDSKSVPDDHLARLEKESARIGRAGKELDYSLLVDGLEAEREQGITIDVAYRYFATSRRSFIIADTPGHQQYTRNMATGASTSELAIILVDARLGILPQTIRHLWIVRLLGIRNVVLAVNKMDLVAWSQETFNDICSVFQDAVQKLGACEVVAIPVSAVTGREYCSAGHRHRLVRRANAAGAS